MAGLRRLSQITAECNFRCHLVTDAQRQKHPKYGIPLDKKVLTTSTPPVACGCSGGIMDASVPADGWPTVPNPSRVPVADLTQGVEMFADKPLLLGGSHRVDPAQADTVPCGAGCPHRLESITCPYYRQPCLVGCRVKQVLSGHGLEYQEIDIFVVAQSGQWLIGEMVVLNLAHPRSAFTRIVTNKRGAPVFAGGAGENLLDVVPATILSEKP